MANRTDPGLAPHPAPRAAAAALLGRAFESEGEAAKALAALATDAKALGELLAGLPGGALVALRLFAELKHPLGSDECARLLDLDLGPGRGRDALSSLLGRGFLLQTDAPRPRYELWAPLREPLRSVLAGVDVQAPGEAASGAAPDRAGVAVALLLGQLWRSRPKVTRDGSVYKKQAEELERLFAPSLGAGVVELLCVAFRRMGLLALEAPEDVRGGTARLAPGDDPAAFLTRPRAERARAFATAGAILPRWLEPAFSAGPNAVGRGALCRAAARAETPSSDVDATLGFCVATGILRELPEGLTASAEIRGAPAPEPPSGGRWMVQPNLEIVLPPDVPPADAFRLACVAELASLDRAAVLKLGPAALRQAAEAGLGAEEILRRLAARASATLPDLVVRAVRDGARARPATMLQAGVVVVVPEDALAAVREAVGDFAQELAPGVFLAEYDDEPRLRKALAGEGVRVWTRATTFRSSLSGMEPQGDRALQELLRAGPVPPADPRLAQAVARARAGDAAAFTRTERPVVNESRPAAPRAPLPSAVDGLLDELLHRLERGKRIPIERIPLVQRAGFLSRLERVLAGRLDPGRLGPEFADGLRRVLGAGAAPAPAPAREPPPTGRDAAPELSPAWEALAEQAIGARRDLWLALRDEHRPRLVTPHRIARSGERVELLALAHDSGDLRAYAAPRIGGAAVAGASAQDHLPGAGPERAALHAARNEPCPCGSGRKYKACCLPKDLAGQAAG